MLCFRCQKKDAKYRIQYTQGLKKESEYVCETCYQQGVSSQWQEEERVIAAAACPFCENLMEDYLRSGLVGCAKCYSFFKKELAAYIVRIQGNGEHRGKEASKDPKYEAAQVLRELLVERQQAEEAKDVVLAQKIARKADELKLLLFGDEEEE